LEVGGKKGRGQRLEVGGQMSEDREQGNDPHLGPDAHATFNDLSTGDRDVASLLTNWVVPQHLLKKASDGKQNIFFLGKIYETQRSCSLKTNITPPN
jgi:hypothetical protein